MFNIPPNSSSSQESDSVFDSDQIVLIVHLTAPDLPQPPLVVHEPTIEALVSGRTWETVAADDKIRFLVGIAQMFGTGAGCIITQPTERVHWRALVAAGLITYNEHDPYLLNLTTSGNILFYTVLGQYIPVEERR